MKIFIYVCVLQCYLASIGHSQIVNLTNSSGSLGSELDQLTAGEAWNGPAEFDVPEIAGLKIIIPNISSSTGSGNTKLVSTSTGLGVDTAEADESDGDIAFRFDKDSEEHLFLRFNKAITVSNISFSDFDNGESFLFIGRTFAFSDLDSNGSVDISSNPIFLAAGGNTLFMATNGSIGLTSFAAEVAVVPESSTIWLLVILTGLFWVIRGNRTSRTQRLSQPI